MDLMATSEPLRFHGLVVSAAEIAEVQDGRRVTAIPRSAIRTIRLEHGIVAERPLLQALFGLALLVPGVFLGGRPWWRFFTTTHLPPFPKSVLIAPLFLVFLGAWALRDVIRRGWFLRVETGNDARKLRIAGQVDRAALMAFIERVRNELRYDVRDIQPP